MLPVPGYGSKDSGVARHESHRKVSFERGVWQLRLADGIDVLQWPIPQSHQVSFTTQRLDPLNVFRVDAGEREQDIMDLWFPLLFWERFIGFKRSSALYLYYDHIGRFTGTCRVQVHCAFATESCI
jgi:hypothetical protein